MWLWKSARQISLPNILRVNRVHENTSDYTAGINISSSVLCEKNVFIQKRVACISVKGEDSLEGKEYAGRKTIALTARKVCHGVRGSGWGCEREDSRTTTTDFELNSVRAWNSILNSAGHVEWAKFVFVSSFQVRATCRVHLILRLAELREFGTCPLLFILRTIMRAHVLKQSHIFLQILQLIQSFLFNK